MSLDFNKNITFSKKKDAYPSKKSINLYFKEDKTTRPATIALYVLFIAVVCLLLVKLLVVDMSAGLVEKQEEIAKKQAILDERNALLEEYDEVESEYNRFVSSYLRDDEKIWNRIDVLKMLDETIYQYGDVGSVSIINKNISTTVVGPDLEKTVELVEKLEGYNMVDHVTVSTATLSGKHMINISITLTDVSTETIGGEQE